MNKNRARMPASEICGGCMDCKVKWVGEGKTATITHDFEIVDE